MRSAAPDIDQVQLLKRVTVNPELDLIVALGAEKGWNTSQGNFTCWATTEPSASYYSGAIGRI